MERTKKAATAPGRKSGEHPAIVALGLAGLALIVIECGYAALRVADALPGVAR